MAVETISNRQPTRYTLLLEEDAAMTVERLQTVHGLRSRAAVFDLAITLLDWAANSRSSGFRIGRVNDDGNFQELLVPVAINS